MAKRKGKKPPCAYCGGPLPVNRSKYCRDHCAKKMAAERKKTGKPDGRPTDYTVILGKEICLRLVGGETLNKICEDEHMPCVSTVHNWLSDESKPEFLLSYRLAREAQADMLGDEILDIADDASGDVTEWEETTTKTTPADGEGDPIVETTVRRGARTNPTNVARDKLRMEARAKIARTYNPRKWGDFKVLEHQGEVAHVKRVVRDGEDFDE